MQSSFTSYVPLKFWNDAVLTTYYLINRTPYLLSDIHNLKFILILLVSPIALNARTNSCPIPASSLATCLPFDDQFPIAIRKSTHSLCNPYLSIIFLVIIVCHHFIVLLSHFCLLCLFLRILERHFMI